MSLICDSAAPLSLDHPNLSLHRLETFQLRDLREAYESFEWEQMSYKRTMQHYGSRYGLPIEGEPVPPQYTAAKHAYDLITAILERINSVIIRKQECRSVTRDNAFVGGD